jgi:hypothetical protein
MICSHKQGRVCTKGLHGGRPSNGVCIHLCKERRVDKTLPSIPRMAANFGKAFVTHAMSRFKNRPEEEQQRYINICRTNQCGHYVIIDGEERCTNKKCGCYLKLKTRWSSSACPIGKWPAMVTFICCVAHIGDLMCVEPFVRYYKKLYPEKNIRIVSRWPELYSDHPDIVASLSCGGEKYPEYPDPKLWYSIDDKTHITQWMPKFNNMLLPADFDYVPRFYLDAKYCEKCINAIDFDFSQPYVVVNPKTTTSIREWSWDKWAMVVNKLHGENFKVVQIGLASDRLISGIDLNLLGITSDLQQVGFIIKNSKFYIGMDSGCAHLAAAVKKKAVVIFGSGRESLLCHDGFTYPVTGKSNLAKCDICSKEKFRHTCERKPLEICMSMSVDEVWEKIGEVQNEI